MENLRYSSHIKTERLEKKTEQSSQEIFDSLYFAARRSLKYHDYRQSHFKFWVDCIVFTSIALGAISAYIFAYEDQIASPTEGLSIYFKTSFPLTITLINALLLVFRLFDKHQIHMNLRIKFQELAAHLENLKIEGDISVETIARANQQRAEIQVNEPKVLRVLDVMCHNETNQSLGHNHNFYKIRSYQKWFAKYFDLGPISFKEQEART